MGGSVNGLEAKLRATRLNRRPDSPARLTRTLFGMGNPRNLTHSLRECELPVLSYGIARTGPRQWTARQVGERIVRLGSFALHFQRDGKAFAETHLASNVLREKIKRKLYFR
jgi:hypothetical protein